MNSITPEELQQAKAKAQATPAKAKATTAKPKASAAKASPARAKAATGSRASSEFKNFEPYTTKRGEVYMNEKQREHFKAILLNWKAELMQEVDRTVTHMKDEAANWYVFDDNFGTSEEKYLVKYIAEALDKLKENYTDIYLLRNEKLFKIYAFEDGSAYRGGKNNLFYYEIKIHQNKSHL